MAGKGGGAWKVAYADFVTAMMAFFLVMWLVSQDQKVKESIAHYFQGPVGIQLLGDSARQKQSGGMFYSEVMGPVPGHTDIAAGRSIGTSPEPPEHNSDTMAVAEWLLENKGASNYWKQEAQRLYDQAKQAHPDRRDQTYFDKIVRPQLVAQMHRELSQPVLDKLTGIHRDLLLNSLSNVDWNAIADECLLQTHNQ
ncbi:flagellar motor protein MotB [Planctomicrobium piriforme]|uniref:Membrane MotB of proton-channel complex MotA/MotB n=1 Tax=Planctomicrobium piriforme TaxID=1576369 RepID=A0A1I3BAC5_9PLAN|nr:flagellar motor protein MotB [Planctomicrobium piriforme]SFH59255.1 Membrane MotB of proton-channel complex MotA/MotB [Planctomicrobium piriforme]